ncbi:MAG: hypothetical protein ACFFCL_16855 [Promethearchaeota archaeon]
MLKRRFTKVSIVAIILIMASSFVGYGIIIYSTAQSPPQKEPIMVGILDPDYGDTISGEIMIRAMILHSHPSWGYTISVMINGTEISSSIPFDWDSTTVDDGWWNITVRVIDTKGNVGSDEVLIYVENHPLIVVEILSPEYDEVVSGIIEINAIIYQTHPNWDYTISVLLNGMEIATSLPAKFFSTHYPDDKWTITVIVTDSKGNVGSDEVLFRTINYAQRIWEKVGTGTFYGDKWSYAPIKNPDSGEIIRLKVNYPTYARYQIEFSGSFSLKGMWKLNGYPVHIRYWINPVITESVTFKITGDETITPFTFSWFADLPPGDLNPITIVMECWAEWHPMHLGDVKIYNPILHVSVVTLIKTY